MSTYTRGPSTYRSPHARVETKPSPRYGAHTRDTGGGYERVRSWEHDPTKAGDRKRDVYAAVHRLCAVAWCYPAEWSVGEILDDLDGSDVHHEDGVEWHNAEGNLEVLDHGRHSEVTNAQRRAWAEDAQRSLSDDPDVGDVCDRCGDAVDVLTVSDDWSGQYCVACSKAASDGSPIEVV